MSFQYGKLTEVSPVPQSAGALYSNPPNAKSYLSSILIHNWGTVSRAVTLNIVPDVGGVLGTPSTGNQVAKIAVAATETVFIEPKYPFVLIDPADSLFAVADGGGVNAQILGGMDI